MGENKTHHTALQEFMNKYAHVLPEDMYAVCISALLNEQSDNGMTTLDYIALSNHGIKFAIDTDDDAGLKVVLVNNNLPTIGE